MKDLTNLRQRIEKTQREMQYHLTHSEPATVGQTNGADVALMKMIDELAEAVQEVQQYVKNM